MDILIITKEKDIIKKILISQIGNNHQILTTDNPITGLSLYNTLKPSVLFIDDDLDKINGIVFCQIIKELMVKNSISYKDLTIFMFLSKQNINNTKLKDLNINYFISTPIDKDLFTLQIATFFNNFKLGFNTTLEETVKKAQINQAETLPNFIEIENETLSVNYIYSPYLNLSGDLFNYWLDEDNKFLYGYLFDCTGHDLIAWRQTAKIKTIFNYAFRFYDKKVFKSLIEVMNNINEEILFQMDTDSDTSAYVVAIIFKLDIQNKKLYYIPAGMPNILLKDKLEYKEIELCSNLLGFSTDNYQEEVLDVSNAEEIVFCTDGLSDLLTLDNIQNKKDDITAIFIKLKNVFESNTK